MEFAIDKNLPEKWKPAYGYKNNEFFKLKIYTIHNSKYTLCG